MGLGGPETVEQAVGKRPDVKAIQGVDIEPASERMGGGSPEQRLEEEQRGEGEGDE